MGTGSCIRCSSCGYGIHVREGVGMMYSPSAVFYGRCDDPTQNWSGAFPAGLCEDGKPLLLGLVKSERIKKAAFNLLSEGARPGEYGHELYVCPKCMRFENLFYFELVCSSGNYEPDYKCTKCRTIMKPVAIRDSAVQTEIMYRDQRKVEWKCPKCGGEEISWMTDCICWD